MEEKTLILNRGDDAVALGHKDFILDMCLDHYGRRLATSSEDGTITIYKRIQSKSGWVKMFTTPPASSGIIKLTWSHPEFSSLIACCTDRALMVWEEESESKWQLLYVNQEFREQICGAEFGPKHLGLRLALCMADGHVEVFSPTDALRKDWVQRHSFGPEETSRAENRDSSASLVPSCISWNTFPFDSRSMVVSHENSASIWRMDRERRKWRQAGRGIRHDKAINHIAWAPSMGRSFHIIASASSDYTAAIWSVKSSNPKDAGESILGTGQVEIELLQKLEHRSKLDPYPPIEVFKVEWNLTATMLATSCDDGIVRLWVPNLKGEWIHNVDVDDQFDNDTS